MLNRLRHPQSIVAGAILVVVAGVLAAVWFTGDDGSGTPPVPTVPVLNTPANIGCIDAAGTDTGTLTQWYGNDAKGSLQLAGEIVVSSRLGGYSATAVDAIVDTFGSFASSSSRDLAPTTSACSTLRFNSFTLADGSYLEVMAWRLVAAASPMWIPNEAAFVPTGDALLVSQGVHVVTALAVAPDGTTVMVAAYAPGAYDALHGIDGATPTTPVSVEAQQVSSIATTMLAFVVQR
ncbi:MAG: hypothetical protein Q7V88_15965 [Actinomycetota bacterium]|nr:hypothetical protein [Actinomycetota bacterium]